MSRPVFTGVEGRLSLLLPCGREGLCLQDHTRLDSSNIITGGLVFFGRRVLLFPRKTTGKPIASLQLSVKLKASRNWKIKVHEKWAGNLTCDQEQAVPSPSSHTPQLAGQRTTERLGL